MNRVGLFPGQGIPAGCVADALERDEEIKKLAASALDRGVIAHIRSGRQRPGAVIPTWAAQPAIFLASLAGYRAAVARGGSFDAFLGHSMGEYAALVAGGAFSPDQGLRLVSLRGRSMHEAARSGQGGMAAVLALDLDTVETIASAVGLSLANDNAPGQLVLSGSRDALAEGAVLVREAGGRTVLLEVSGAFHTSAMESAAATMRDALDQTEIRSPVVPVVSNVTAAPYRSPGEIRKLLVEQITKPVRFRQAVERLWRAGARDFQDLGPGDVVKGLARRTLADLGREAARV